MKYRNLTVLAVSLLATCCLEALANYPGVQSIIEPTTNYPSSFALFSPPVDHSLTVLGTAPKIAEWTRQGRPGDTIALTGERFSSSEDPSETGNGSRFVFYGYGWPVAEGSVLTVEGRQCGLTLPENLPENEMYLMWPGNTSGFGEPVAINQTESWWVGPDKVSAGESFSVYGRNLSLGDNHTWLWCEERGEWLSSEAQNPYKADFTVPPGWPSGTYTLWPHNSFGKQYGWADSITIEIWPGPQFSDNPDTWINVKDPAYGAKGDGVSDDYAALNAAYIAAQSSPYSTIYFPPGSYAVSKHLFLWTVNSGIRLKGAGMDSTTIFPIADVAPYPLIAVRKDNTYIEDLAISTGDKDSAAALYVENCSNSRFSNVRLSSLESEHGEHIFKSLAAHGVIFKDSEFLVSWTMWNEQSDSLFFENCNFRGVYDCNVMIGGHTTRQSIYNCRAGPYDESDASVGTGWSKGRWIGGSNYGANNWYIGNNVSTNMRPRMATPRFSSAITSFTMMGDDPTQSDPKWLWMKIDVPSMPDDLKLYGDMVMDVTAGNDEHIGYWLREVDPDAKTAMVSIPDWRKVPSDTTGTRADFRDHPDQNSGEQILFEGGHTIYRGLPGSISETSATFDNLSSYLTSVKDYHYVMVAHGQGLGQLRKIVSIDSGTIGIGKPWTVKPNKDSVLMIGKYGCNWAVYDNFLDGVPSTKVSASTGFQITGGGHSVVVDGNTFHETWTGISTYPELFTNFDSSINTVSPQYFCLYLSNTLINNRNGISGNIYLGAPSLPDPFSDIAMVGNVWRGNNLENTIETAIGFECADSKHYGLSILDSNIMSNVRNGVLEIGGVDGKLWIDNVFHGTDGGYGYNIAAGHTPFLRNNSWDNFGTAFAGNIPNGYIKIPFRFISLNSSANQIDVPVWNCGVLPVSWEVGSIETSDGGTWLTATQPVGNTVPDERAEGWLSLSVNEAECPVSPVFAVVTIVSDTNVEKITVHYDPKQIPNEWIVEYEIDFDFEVQVVLRNLGTGSEIVVETIANPENYRLRIPRNLTEPGNTYEIVIRKASDANPNDWVEALEMTPNFRT